jgi:tetratricopeptide (TPR) repeat protein
MRLRWLRIPLIVAIVLIVGFLYLERKRAEEERQQDATLASMRQSNARAEFIRNQNGTPSGPRLDWAMRETPPGFRIAVSPWEAAEKARYRALIPPGCADVLLVPFQVEGYALDRSTRSLMLAQLSLALRDNGVRVADPWLVLKALGENRREMQSSDVHELAGHVGAKRIVWLHTGHDGQNHMIVSFREELPVGGIGFPGNVGAEATRFEKVPIGDETPAVVAYQALMPQIVEKLGFGKRAAVAPAAATFDDSLPASPLRMSEGKPDPIADAHYFLGLAALLPGPAQRTRETFTEKAFLAETRMDPGHPDFRLLRARTLMLMGLRPAALQSLGTPSNEAEKALLGMLNGNLPDVARSAGAIRPGFRRMVTELDLAEIRREYGVEDDRASAEALGKIAPGNETWAWFLARAALDGDPWKQFDNLALKSLLDRELPVEGFTADGLMSGAQALLDPSKVKPAIDFSVRDHVGRLFAADGRKWCCANDWTHPSTLDYLEFVEAISMDNLVRRAAFIGLTQGLPDEALREIGHLDSIYKGHPGLSLTRARVQAAAARRAEGAAREGLVRSAYAEALDVFHREQGQTQYAAAALMFLTGLQRHDLGDFTNLYVNDIPFRADYPTWDNRFAGMDRPLQNARRALAGATIDTTPVFDLKWKLVDIQRKADEFGRVLASIEDRFQGNSNIYVLRAENSEDLGRPDAAEADLRKAIAIQPDAWPPYRELVSLLFRQARVEESAKVAMSYPGLKVRPGENPVGVSNVAHELGSHFYWGGHLDPARQLYRISADLDTGSQASITSKARLALLSGDYAGFLAGTFQRSQRYGVSYAYRDYLSMLHAMGNSREAWDGFASLVASQPEPHIWESALVGHRRANVAGPEIAAWVDQDALRNAGERVGFAAMYVVRAATTDRIPTDADLSALAGVDRPVWLVADSRRHVVRPSSDGRYETVLGPDTNEGSTLPMGVFESSQKTRIASELDYFMRAYRHIEGGEYDAARALLEEAGTHYDPRLVNQAYLVPHLAFAAAMSGKTAGVEAMLARFGPSQQGFDYYLAKGALAALSRKPGDAVPLLQKARHRRPYTESRPQFTEYQYGEMLEWLFQATRDARYRDMALEWARACRTTQPWHAWAHAMEAKLAAPGVDRQRAMAMARYLDPDSQRLKSLPKAQVETAFQRFNPANPFLKLARRGDEPT